MVPKMNQYILKNMRSSEYKKATAYMKEGRGGERGRD